MSVDVVAVLSATLAAQECSAEYVGDVLGVVVVGAHGAVAAVAFEPVFAVASVGAGKFVVWAVFVGWYREVGAVVVRVVDAYWWLDEQDPQLWVGVVLCVVWAKCRVEVWCVRWAA